MADLIHHEKVDKGHRTLKSNNAALYWDRRIADEPQAGRGYLLLARSDRGPFATAKGIKGQCILQLFVTWCLSMSRPDATPQNDSRSQFNILGEMQSFGW